MRLIAIILTTLMLSGCVWLQKATKMRPEDRLNRIILRNPHLMSIDTTIWHDTIITDIIKLDTTFILSETGHDSIVIREEKVITYIYRNTDTIRVYTEVQPDTIVETRIEVTKGIHTTEIVTDPYKSIVIGIIAFFIAFIIVAICFKWLFKRNK